MESNQNAVIAVNNDNRVKKAVTVGAILVDKIYKGDFQKPGTLTVQLKQTIDTEAVYPAKSVTSSLQDNVFGLEAFGFEEGQKFNSSETRTAWLDVPEALATEAAVKEQLAKFPNSRLYRILSNHPILSDNQVYGITAGLTTKDIIANRQAVRYGEGHEKAGELIMDPNGKVQYKGIYFSKDGVADMEKRTEDTTDVYLTPEIQHELELSGVIKTDGIN